MLPKVPQTHFGCQRALGVKYNTLQFAFSENHIELQVKVLITNSKSPHSFYLSLFSLSLVTTLTLPIVLSSDP
jgi:hypothetical protein